MSGAGKIWAYYNENDPFAAAWLRELIRAGHIAPGLVDERSIEDVVPNDLAGFIQCHFFAGIGVWSHALRRADWPDDRPVWTGSCPCQGFSCAGQRKGFADERHLWPALFRLIGQCRPEVVFGEQVASKDGLLWLDLVSSDLENAGYACGAVDLCAAGFGAPHIRQRLYWVADALPAGRPARRAESGHGPAAGSGGPDRLADAHHPGWKRRSGTAGGDKRFARPGGLAGGLEHPGSRGRERREAAPPGDFPDGSAPQRPEGEHGTGLASAPRFSEHYAGPADGHWRNADWLLCRDGKWRPVEPGTFPLAHGAPSRVGRLRGYGNAIVAPQAEAFIRAYMDIAAAGETRLWA